MKVLPPLGMTNRLEQATVLDPLVNGMSRLVNTLVRPRWLRDILHGVPIGHPLHPMAVQVPLGAWVSAAVLDAAPGTQRAAQTLVGVGVLSAVPTAVAGYTDWAKLNPDQQRVGLVHSGANLLAVILYAASYVQRARGRQTSGKALGAAGLAVVSVGGYLGGHLAYRQSAGPNHTDEIHNHFPAGWQRLAPLSEIPEGKLEQRIVEQTQLLVYRQGNDVHVLSDVCSHLTGPLHEGKLLQTPEACVECPWHQSVFSLETGDVVHGPATAPQPKFRTRLTDGTVEICLPDAG